MPVIAAAHSGVHARDALAQELERRRDAGAVGERVVAFERRVAAVGDAFRVRRLDSCRDAVSKTSLLCGSRPSPGGPFAGSGSKREQALALAVVEHDELRRVGVALQEGVVDQVAARSARAAAP